jgi:hypothetical protein
MLHLHPHLLSAMLLSGMTAATLAGDDAAYEGYTLYNQLMGSNTTLLVDMDGNTVHSWEGASPIASTPYLFQGGDLLRPCRAPGQISMNGAAAGGRVQRISIDGEILWDYIFSDANNQPHHDICPMPNGNVLLVAWERRSQEEASAFGRNNPGEMWPTQIIEVKQTGALSGEIVWRWRLWDHLIQDVHPGLPNFGVVADHPERLDINKSGIQNGDWIHVNALDYNPELDQIVFSSNSLDEIIIIDHSTTTTEAASSSGGRSGMGGDFLYRWGNSLNYHRGTAQDHVLFNVHGVNWIDPGLSGEGNLILFNNGNDDDTSDLIEFLPPFDEKTGTYLIDEGEPFEPARDDYTWFYEQAGFHGDHLCGVYRLPNGNTLATNGPDREIREIDTEGNTVWTLFTTQNIMRANKYPRDILEPPVACVGDFNLDGTIDGADLATLLGFWGLPDTDLTGDGVTGGADITLLLSNWGPCS